MGAFKGFFEGSFEGSCRSLHSPSDSPPPLCPVEVSKLEARPATAPLRPNLRDAASFVVASLSSAQLHGARRHPLLKRCIGRRRGLR